MNNSESDSYDTNDIQKKLNALVRLHKVMQEKSETAHHIQNQSKFLHWYLINGLECIIQNILITLNNLFELQMKSKK